jgi:hypothetical protein
VKPGFLGLIAVNLFGLNPAWAQPLLPCAVVCEPPARLDAKACVCRTPGPAIARPCSLVCLGPGETLDARQCRCVRK